MKNPNLFISNSRVSLRNLPKKEFYEKELKDLMNLVVEEYMKTKKLDETQIKYELTHKKFIKQVKVLRSEQKKDKDGNELPSGIGFAEFYDNKITEYAINYLNNLELITDKGLIVDYSLED